MGMSFSVGHIGKNLKMVRNRLNLSQEEVARDLGVKLSTYGAWERDTNLIPLDYLGTFCELYKVDFLELIPSFKADNQRKGDVLELLEMLKTAPQNEAIILSLKDQFFALTQEVSELRGKLIEEKEKMEKMLEKAEKSFGITIPRE